MPVRRTGGEGRRAGREPARRAAAHARREHMPRLPGHGAACCPVARRARPSVRPCVQDAMPDGAERDGAVTDNHMRVVYGLLFQQVIGRRSVPFVAGVNAGVMQTRDGRWRVEVGGAGSIVWYRLSGPGVHRALPSTAALIDALAKVGVDLAELVEHSA